MESKFKFCTWNEEYLGPLPTFFEVAIFLNSSRRISLSFPTVCLNIFSSHSRFPLSKPAGGLKQKFDLLIGRNYRPRIQVLIVKTLVNERHW